MKLKKKDIVLLLSGSLNNLGYKTIKDSTSGAEGLFIKIVNENYYLSLGVTISRFYNSRFTADFYLSRTTIFGATWGDIPEESYKRVSEFLSIEERNRLVNSEFIQEGIVDAWWNAALPKEIEMFIESVKITEQRFLLQKQLLAKIDSSKDLNEMVQHVKEVFRFLSTNAPPDFRYKYIPNKVIDDIPIEWFQAAERALLNHNNILNINTVIRLASDAWRQNLLDPNFKSKG